MIYLSDKIKELPKNCLFDKGKVGCGGTTLAIEGSEPYVIAVPYAGLVENKVRQYPNERCPYRLFGVSEGVTPDSIRKYLPQAAVPKIMTTYDSLGKVMEAFGDVSGINLLIDEYHTLFTQYSFRKDAIMGVLKNFRRFRSFTFMTATPLEEDLTLDELKGIPVVTQEWNENEKFTVSVKQIKCRNVMASAVKMIKGFLSGELEGNAYFFVNSVRAIKELVQMAGLTEENCRVIYSKGNRANVGIQNSDIDSRPKKINFLTSTVFEGCDIFDKDGVTIILSDPYFKNSLLDISTSVQQIAGRIRDSRFIGEIYHLFSSTKSRYSGNLSTEDFKKYIMDEIEKNKRIVKEYNGLSEEGREGITEHKFPYIEMGDDGLYHFDPNRPKIDLFNYMVCNVYSSTVTLREEYGRYHIDTESSSERLTLDNMRINSGAGIDKTFKETVQEIRGASGIKRTILIKEASLIYPFLPDAISKLGFERIESLKYSQKAIKDELNLISDHSTDFKICKKLGYSTGEFRSNAKIKSDLEKAYKSLKLSRTAKAVDISRFYEVKKSKKRINGELTEGYTVRSPKYRIAS